MKFVVTVTFGLLVWIVLWATGHKGFDAMLLTLTIVLIGAMVKLASGYLPGNRRD